MATVIWMLQMWRADMRITSTDKVWRDNMRHYIRNEDELMPPVDRYNFGQKMFFWVMLWASLVLLLSGAVLWFPEYIPWQFRGLRFAAVLLHEGAALITIGAFIIHVYMGVSMVRGSLTAMVRGVVPASWAKAHHRLWYYRVIGR
jgi:formate dehydrogenase subunit gamma